VDLLAGGGACLAPVAVAEIDHHRPLRDGTLPGTRCRDLATARGRRAGVLEHTHAESRAQPSCAEEPDEASAGDWPAAACRSRFYGRGGRGVAGRPLRVAERGRAGVRLRRGPACLALRVPVRHAVDLAASGATSAPR
jgi:hypothetical protein